MLQRYLFLNNTYYFDSGGDPTDIPDLTFDETVVGIRACMAAASGWHYDGMSATQLAPNPIHPAVRIEFNAAPGLPLLHFK